MVPPERNSKSVISSPHCFALFFAGKKKKDNKEGSQGTRTLVTLGGLEEKKKKNVRNRNNIGKTRQMRDLKGGSVRNHFMKMTLQRDSNKREMSEDATCS